MSYNRFRLTAANGSNDINHNPTLYVAMPADGGDDANSGATAANPLATIQCAVNKIKDEYDTTGYAPVIKIADGQYIGWQDYGPMIGRHKKGGGPIIFIGNLSNPEAVRIFHAAGTHVVSYDGYAQAVIVGMRIDGNQSQAVYATTGSVIELGLVTVSGPIPILAESGGKIFGTSTLKFLGSMVYGAHANKFGHFEIVPGVIVQFEDSTFSQHWLFASNQALIVCPYKPDTPGAGVTFQGSFVGRKAFASLLSVVNSGYQTYNLFPGTLDADKNEGGVLN